MVTSQMPSRSHDAAIDLPLQHGLRETGNSSCDSGRLLLARYPSTLCIIGGVGYSGEGFG